MTAKAVILGTFHMRQSSDMFNWKVDDLLGPKRQAEIREVSERMKRFRPTKVAVEIVAKEEDAMNAAYRAYLAGEIPLGPNELHQLGFRIAAGLGHDRVYAVDWMEDTGSRSVGDVWEWAKEHQPALFNEIFGHLSAERSSTAASSSGILDMLRSSNEPAAVKRTHQMYVNLARIGAGQDYVGMGWLRWWYERNLIIFANTTRLIESVGDRILLIIGASHIHLVSQFMRESGLFEVASGYDYLA